MCTICGMFFNRILCLKSLKRFFGSKSSGSYVHNPGLEPLQYTTVGAIVACTARAHPGRIALRSVHEDVTLTYEELLTQADSLGYALRDQGLKKGDRLGIWSHNSAANVIGIIAAARAGLIAVTINSHYEVSELNYCIDKTGIKCLLLGDNLKNRNYYHLLSKLIPELNKYKPGSLKSDKFPILTSVITAGKDKMPGTFNFNSLIEAYKKHAHKMTKYHEEISPDEGCLIHFTSGTTGKPKAALDSHFGIVNNIYFSGKTNNLHEMHHKVCVQVPIFHALGSVTTVLGAFRHGCTLVLPGPTYSVNSTIKALYEEKCSFLTGTPTMYVDLVNRIRYQSTPPPNLKVAVTAGASCNRVLISNMQKYFKINSVTNLYGMTETTASIFQSLPGDSIDLVADTVGHLQDHIEAKVVNEEGNLVPFGTPGELLVRGYGNMLYYWNEPEKTNAALGKDKWLRTGDKFILSEDGYGCIVGRLKDIIVRGGENIAPKEIEAVLDTHPDVIESQVVGVSDERLGEELCAVVRVREGGSLDAAAVARHCGGRLARFKIPRLFKQINEFPKTASGKIQKYKLREMVESGKL